MLDQLLASDAMYFVLLGLVFAAVSALFIGVRYIFASRVDVVGQRVKRSVASAPSSFPPPPVDSRPGTAHSAVDRMLKTFGWIAKPGNEQRMGLIRSQLSYAGYRNDRAVANYLASKVLLSVLLGGLFVYVSSRLATPIKYGPFFAVTLMVVGFYFPNAWLAGRVQERQNKLLHALPDALDLLVTCVEAGLGLDFALNRVAGEIELSSPLLAEELHQTSREMRAGIPRGDSFRRLADRTGVDEIRNLASIIVQTEIFGTSVSKSLRVMSDGMRVRRMQRAEEKAATVAVKMTVPLVLCILPSLFVVLGGPAVVRFVRILMPQLGGGG